MCPIFRASRAKVATVYPYMYYIGSLETGVTCIYIHVYAYINMILSRLMTKRKCFVGMLFKHQVENKQ